MELVAGSVEIFARPEVRAAVPGLLAALREQPAVRQSLWRAFTAEPVAMFAEKQPGLDEEAALDATAIIVLAAGGALLASALADQDDTPALRRRIEAILLAGSDAPRATATGVELTDDDTEVAVPLVSDMP